MAIEHKPHLTQQAHRRIQEHFSSIDIKPTTAIDATCGNGFDTLFLAELVSERVYAFDIQSRALNITHEKLLKKQLDSNVELIKSGHENMDDFINSPIDVGMFNFGYLPKADKSITTMASTSLKALNSALELLSPHGIISILCYPGHEEGRKEALAIEQWLQGLADNILVAKFLSNYPNNISPVLFTVNFKHH